MKLPNHREATQPLSTVQPGNERWWSENPMTYDWTGDIGEPPLSPQWFAAVDAEFIRASKPYTTAVQPFDLIMPADLVGKQVLEIGCGMGLHTAELVRRGATVTAIDITDFAVKATSERLRQQGLSAEVHRIDAEALPFVDGQFDLVWSWGVIHHSSCTTRIVREIARVLQPQGEARVMVYNRQSFKARYLLARYYFLAGEFRHRTPDEVLWNHTDGFLARHYPPELFNDLFQGFFTSTDMQTLGLESDAFPLPAVLRKRIVPLVSADRKRRMASKRGYFLFVTAFHPS